MEKLYSKLAEENVAERCVSYSLDELDDVILEFTSYLPIFIEKLEPDQVQVLLRPISRLADFIRQTKKEECNITN